MSENPSNESRAINSLRRIVRALRTVGGLAERNAGVSGAQLFVLQQLAVKPEQSVSELMARTLTSQSSVSEVVARLVDQRLISRRRSTRDARRVVLALTPRGKAAVKSAPRSAQSRLIAGMQAMSPSKRRQLAALLEQWLAEAGMGHVPATMFLEDEVKDNGRVRGRSRRGDRSKRVAR